MCTYVPVLDFQEKFTPAVISTADLLWMFFFHVNCETGPFLSSLCRRAPDPRQGQRVLRHVHHRQLRLCIASALEEPQETLWLLFQPGSPTEEPLCQVRSVLNVARSLAEPRRSRRGFSRAEDTRNDLTCPSWQKSDTKRRHSRITIQTGDSTLGFLFYLLNMVPQTSL